MTDGTTIHDRVRIIKNQVELDIGGGGDYSIPPHGATHVQSGTDPVPPEIDGIEADMAGIVDGQVPLFNAAQNKFLPGSGGGGGGAVDSVFGRTGVVVAEADDYGTNEITDDSDLAKLTATAALNALAGGEATTLESHGWEDIFSYSITFDDPTRTLQIDVPTSPVPRAYYTHWQMGRKYTKTAPETITIPDEEGHFLIYFEDGGLKYEKNPTQAFISTSIRTTVYVSFIYWNATDKKSERFHIEPHTRGMPPATHAYEHFAEGAVYISGLDLTGFVIDNGNDLEDAQWGTNSGIFFDEDVPHFPPTTAPTVGGSQAYIIGAEANPQLRLGTPVAGTWLQTAGTGRLAINVNNAGTWEVQEAGSGDFVLCHMLVDNSVAAGERWFSRMGQASYSSLANAETGIITESRALNLLGIAEIGHVGTIVLQTRSTYGNAVKARVVQLADGSDWFDWRQTSAGGGSAGSSAQLFNDLLDVNVPSPLDSELVKYNALSGVWENFGQYGDAETIHGTDIIDPALDVFRYGEQLAENTGFDTDVDWSKGTGWSIAAGVATKVAGNATNLSQVIDTIPGNTYRVRFEIKTFVGGLFVPFVGGTSGTAVGAVGKYDENIVATSGASVGVATNSAAAGDVDNYTIEEIIPTKNTGKPLQLDWVQNLFSHSEDLTNIVWDKSFVDINTSTGLNSPLINRETGLPVPYQGIVCTAGLGRHRVFQRVSLPAVGAVFSVFVKSGIVGTIRFQNSTSGSSVWIDIDNKIIENATADVSVSFLIHRDGCELRISDDIAVVGNNDIFLYVTQGYPNVDFAGDGVSEYIYVTGFQLYKGTIADNFPYVKTTTAPETGRSVYRATTPLLSNNADVDTVEKVDGSTLAYNADTDKWEATKGVTIIDPTVLQRVDNLQWETAQVGVEYFSPDKQGGIYGKVVRQYFGAVLNSQIMVSDANLIDCEFDLIYSTNRWTIRSDFWRSATINASITELPASNVITAAVGTSVTVPRAWVDYTLLTPPTTSPSGQQFEDANGQLRKRVDTGVWELPTPAYRYVDCRPVWDADIAPANPSIFDDEFDIDAFDAKWTVTDVNGYSTIAHPGYGVRVALARQVATGFANSIHITQAGVPDYTKTWSMVAKVSIGCAVENGGQGVNAFVGVGLFDTLAATPAFTGCSIQMTTAAIGSIAGLIAITTGTGIVVGNTVDLAGAAPVYLRIDKLGTAAYTSANNYLYSVSFDGIQWFAIENYSSTYLNIPTKFGFLLQGPNTAGEEGTVVLHGYRFIEDGLGDNPLPGKLIYVDTK